MVHYGAAFPGVSDGVAWSALPRRAGCVSDGIAPWQAIGVYRAGVDRGGVSPLTTAQNKKTLPNPTRLCAVRTPPKPTRCHRYAIFVKRQP